MGAHVVCIVRHECEMVIVVSMSSRLHAYSRASKHQACYVQACNASIAQAPRAIALCISVYVQIDTYIHACMCKFSWKRSRSVYDLMYSCIYIFMEAITLSI